MGDWKAVRLNVSVMVDSPIELYNLMIDPQEKDNVAAKYPEIVRQMEKIMKQEHSPNPNWPLFESEKLGMKKF
jgi:hypothetical protein